MILFIPRYISEKQKALIAAFAELDDDMSGTVNGVDRKGRNLQPLARIKHTHRGDIYSGRLSR